MRSDSRRPLFVLFLCLLISFVCVAYPMYVIRPFRAQGAGELAWALQIIRYRPIITVLAGLLSAGAAWWYWHAQEGTLRRVLAVAGAGIVCGLALLTRINVYELMFHPLDHPAFAAVQQVKLDKDEKVIAVKFGSTARAYPIRNMSYHHVVNDVVNNVPIVATY